MEGSAEDAEETQQLIRKAAIVLNPKIKKYKFDEVQNILECEFPIDTEVTDTKMSALSLACTLQDDTDQLK